MGKVTILVIAVICALSALTGISKESGVKGPEQRTNPALKDKVGAINLTIATVGPMFTSPKDRFLVGEQVPVTIRMTNTSSQPTYACVSSDLYQDLPKLTKNGQLLPYSKWQSEVMRNAQADATCQHDDLPETILLKANEPTVIDFLVLVDDSVLPTGALSWYDQLTPGVYELSLQRRIGCCDGPMIDSNKISFDVVPLGVNRMFFLMHTGS